MVLSNLYLPSRANQCWQFSGIDHITNCINKEHFKSYPYHVEYVYNSKGFRDEEWPESLEELKNAIWCIGDSFTVGIGAPRTHTWPYILAKISGKRVINISMDGASNQWIARTTKKIVSEIQPKHIVIMWSHTHRREHQDTSLSDEDRRIFNHRDQISDSLDDDWSNFLQCKEQVDSITESTQFTIPNFHPNVFFSVDACWDQIRGPSWPNAPTTLNELNALPTFILDEIKHLHNCFDSIKQALTQRFIIVNQIDTARDGHHFDILTATWVANQALLRLS